MWNLSDFVIKYPQLIFTYIDLCLLWLLEWVNAICEFIGIFFHKVTEEHYGLQERIAGGMGFGFSLFVQTSLKHKADRDTGFN